MMDKQKQDNERKIIKQSHPFKSAKSEAIFRLVETDGGMQIEKVTTTVVVLYSLVISRIRRSIIEAVCGSKPELGSSTNKYLEFITIALAIPTRFCIPPLTSEGNL